MMNSPWFAGWRPSEVDALLRQNCAIKTFSRGERIHRDGSASALSFIVSGAVWACIRSGAIPVRVAMVFPQELLGLSALLSAEPVVQAQLEFYAHEETDVLLIPAQALVDLLDNRPVLWRAAAAAAIACHRQCNRFAWSLNAGATRDRLLAAIHQLGVACARRAGQQPRLALGIPQDELAELVQSSRQHVNRALREIEREGLISIGYRLIEIIDAPEIERRVHARFGATEAEEPANAAQLADAEAWTPTGSG